MPPDGIGAEHSGLRFRARRAHGVPRSGQGAPGRPLRLRRRRRVLSVWPPGRAEARRPRPRRDGAADRGAPAGSGGDRLQHGFDHRASAVARTLSGSVRRHRAGHQARLRGLEQQARHRARDRSHRETRIHPQAHPRACQRLRRERSSAPPAAPNSRRPNSKAKPSATRISPPKSPPASSNPAANAPIRSCWPARITRCCWIACKSWRIGRSISSTPPPPSPAASSTCSAPRSPALRPQPAQAIFTSGAKPAPPLAAALAGFGLVEAAPRKCLTPPANPPKYRASRGPSGPRGVSRPAVLPVSASTYPVSAKALSLKCSCALAAKPVGPGECSGAKEGAILNLNST